MKVILIIAAIAPAIYIYVALAYYSAFKNSRLQFGCTGAFTPKTRS